MAAERIVIAELDIDIGTLIKNTSDVKKDLDSLVEAQKELKKAGDTSSKQFVQNAADIKILSKAYNTNIKAINKNTQAVADLTAREDLLNSVLGEEVASIEEAREQNKLLNKLRNTATTTLGEQSEEVKKLNEQLNRNNEFIQANADNYLKQKINIGNYKESIKEAFDEINIFNGGISGFMERSRQAGGAGKLFTSSLKAMTKGMYGMIKASLSFLATPIGAVIGIIGAAFLLVKNAMGRSEEATNKITRAFSGFTGMLKGVLKALEPVGEFLIDILVKYLEFVESYIYAVIDAFAAILKFVGFDDLAASVSGFSESMREASKDAKALADAEAALEKAQRKARLTQLEYQKDAEKLRQIRDDETKSFQERIKANEDLGLVLQKQLQDELKIAQTALEVANLRIKAEGATKDALDAQADALTEIADIEERITGQQSEQLTNRVSLEKEAAEKAKEIREKAINDGIKKLEEELQLYIAQQGVKAKTLEEQLRIEQNIAAKELEIEKKKLEGKKQSQIEYETEVINIKNRLLEKELELVQQNLDRELQLVIDNNQQKIEKETFFTEELLRLENERIQRIEEAQRNAAAKRLQEGIINEQQYQDEITKIQLETQAARDEANALREEAIKEQKAVDIANQRELDLLNFETDFERQKYELEERRRAEVEAAEKVNADVSLIDERYAKLRQQLEEDVSKQKQAVNQQAVGDLASALGEESALGKAAALAQAAINIQQGITKAIALGGFAGIAKGVAVAAAGAKSIGKITSVKTKFAQGGIQEVGGSRHGQGGTKFYGEDGSVFEAEKGEGIGVLSRNSFSGFKSLNKELNNPVSFAGIGQTSNVSQFVNKNNGLSAEDVRSIVNNMPPIYTAVTDINKGQADYAQVVDGANLG